MEATRFESVCRDAATFHTAARAWYLAGKPRDGHVYRAFCEAETVYNHMMDREFPMALPADQAARWSELAVAFGPSKAEYDAGWAMERERLAVGTTP